MKLDCLSALTNPDFACRAWRYRQGEHRPSRPAAARRPAGPAARTQSRQTARHPHTATRPAAGAKPPQVSQQRVQDAISLLHTRPAAARRPAGPAARMQSRQTARHLRTATPPAAGARQSQVSLLAALAVSLVLAGLVQFCIQARQFWEHVPYPERLQPSDKCSTCHSHCAAESSHITADVQRCIQCTCVRTHCVHACDVLAG